MADQEFPSFKILLINITSAALISILNMQEFLTKMREFAVALFLGSLYCLYIWIFEFLKRGHRMGMLNRIPTLIEICSLIINLAWIVTSAIWAFRSFYGLVFDLLRLTISVIFILYGVISIVHHSYLAEASNFWKRLVQLIKNPLNALLRKIDAKLAEEDAAEMEDAAAEMEDAAAAMEDAAAEMEDAAAAMEDAAAEMEDAAAEMEDAAAMEDAATAGHDGLQRQGRSA